MKETDALVVLCFSQAGFKISDSWLLLFVLGEQLVGSPWWRRKLMSCGRCCFTLTPSFILKGGNAATSGPKMILERREQD